MADLDQQLVVRRWRAIRARIAPIVAPPKSRVNVGARDAQHIANSLHCSSFGNKGEHAIHFFSAGISTASLRISFSSVFLPRMR